MKKKDWGNAVWLLFHTLAEKIKDEHTSELPLLVSHISDICNNLPCPDCQQHASKTMTQVNKSTITASKEALIHFLWVFHNNVNKRSKSNFYNKESLDKYKTSNTRNVVNHFIVIMSATSNNEKTMLHSFHRNIYMKKFIEYMNANIHKYNP
jgi:hypothetical protein